MTTQTILLLFVGGLVALIVGAEVLVRGASRLAVAIGITPLVVGMTVVAYGTSAPEMAVTVQAVYAQPTREALAVGNVVGSNISNVLLVLGITALAVPLLVAKTLVRVTVPIMVGVTGLVWWMSLDGVINRQEGLALLAGAVLFSVVSVARSRRATTAALAQSRTNSPPTPKSEKLIGTALNLAAIVGGLVMLVLGARWLVEGASEVARLLEVSEFVVGLTVVAVGTSLPEIATSLVASIRGQRDIAVGNVVGSNIFNLLLVLGFCATVAPAPLTVPNAALRFDIPIMFAVSLACWAIFYTGWIISRWEGLALVVFYAAYVLFIFLNASQNSALGQYETAMLYLVLPITALILVWLTFLHWHKGAPNSNGPSSTKAN